MKEYRNYIFDFYGTLADIRTDEEKPRLWKKMSEIYSALGAPYTWKELKKEFRRLAGGETREAFLTWEAEKTGTAAPGTEVAGTALAPGVETAGIVLALGSGISGTKPSPGSGVTETALAEAEPDLRKVFRRLYLQKGAVCGEAQAICTAVTFRVLSRKFIRPYEGVPELLQELKSRGKGVYLLTNAQTDFTRPEIRQLGLEPYFDGIFISSEQGCKKPSRRFFQKFLETYRLEPVDCLMIGNDETADIAGAGRLGMDTLYFRTAISPGERDGGNPADGLNPANGLNPAGELNPASELSSANGPNPTSELISVSGPNPSGELNPANEPNSASGPNLANGSRTNGIPATYCVLDGDFRKVREIILE